MFSTALPHSCPLKRHQKIPLYSQLHIPHFNPLYLEYAGQPSWPSSYDTVLVICNLIRTHHSRLSAAQNVLLFCGIISGSSAELRTCIFRKAFHFQVFQVFQARDLSYTFFITHTHTHTVLITEKKCLKGILRKKLCSVKTPELSSLATVDFLGEMWPALWTSPFTLSKI